MKLSTRMNIIKNENKIKQLKAENRQLKRVGDIHTIIHLETPHELDYQANYMGECACGCHKALYKGMSVVSMKGLMIHIDCLEAYLKSNLVVL